MYESGTVVRIAGGQLADAAAAEGGRRADAACALTHQMAAVFCGKWRQA